MWRTGKWVYIDEDEPGSEDQQRAPSPPWKLGQVPEETAVFKNGRRMSKRFEKLNQTKTSNTDTKPLKKKNKKKQATSSPSAQAHPPPGSERSIHDSEPSNPPETSSRAHQLHLGPSSPTTTPVLSPRNSHSLTPLPPPPKKPSKSNPSSRTTQPPSVDTHTESHSLDPPSPPPVECSIPSSTLSHPRSSVPPPSADLPPLHAPLKKFKPWEALKGIQTDGAEVAGDLKLIQEGHQRHQKNLETSARKQLNPSQRKRGAAEQATTSGQEMGEGSTQAVGEEESTAREDERCGGSTSSELTELSSSLSDLSSSSSEAPGERASGASLEYSESELEDDCLPQVLVRTVRRPSLSSALVPKNPRQILRWKRRTSAILLHKERKAARRSLDSQLRHPLSHAALNPPNPQPAFEPPPYIKIKANVYPYRKPELSEFPPAVCNCTDGGCGERCLNRAMFYLCDPKLCKMGQSCTNQPFNLRKELIDETSSKLGKGLKVFYTGPVKGWGLKTEIKLKKDSFLIDYRGEIISRDVCYKRVLNDYNGCKHFYLMDYDGSDVIDAGKKGNCARFINHSCSPNLRVERFKLSGLEEYQFGIFTLRDIEVGEELSYDYGWRNFSDIAPTSNVRTSIRAQAAEWESEAEDGKARRRPRRPAPDAVRATAPTVQRCSCDTKGCKGFLGAKKLVIPRPKAKKIAPPAGSKAVARPPSPPNAAKAANKAPPKVSSKASSKLSKASSKVSESAKVAPKEPANALTPAAQTLAPAAAARLPPAGKPFGHKRKRN